MALPGVLTAAVALTGAGQLAAQRVAVFGADEAPPSGPKDAWAASEGVVFRSAPRGGHQASRTKLTVVAGACDMVRLHVNKQTPFTGAETCWCQLLELHARGVAMLHWAPQLSGAPKPRLIRLVLPQQVRMSSSENNRRLLGEATRGCVFTVQAEGAAGGASLSPSRGCTSSANCESTHRRLSDVATRALAHFTARAERAAAGSGADADGDAAGGAAAAALEDLLLWLSSYR